MLLGSPPKQAIRTQVFASRSAFEGLWDNVGTEAQNSYVPWADKGHTPRGGPSFEPQSLAPRTMGPIPVLPHL